MKRKTLRRSTLIGSAILAPSPSINAGILHVRVDRPLGQRLFFPSSSARGETVKTYICVLVLAAILTGPAASAADPTDAATPSQNSLIITIDAYNYSKADQKTVTEAEQIGTGIFRQVGLEIRWIDPSDKEQEEDAEGRPADLTHITVDILPRAMSDRLPHSKEVIGLAPGVGLDRSLVYVFYDRIDRVNDRLQLEARLGGMPVRTAQFFGYAIAHEVGHLLLDTEVHSGPGIMRGIWEFDDLREVIMGRLSFTLEQSGAMRSEVARRVGVYPVADHSASIAGATPHGELEEGSNLSTLKRARAFVKPYLH